MTSAVEGAHSVHRWIARSAERVPEGVRWQTIDYGNLPHYHCHSWSAVIWGFDGPRRPCGVGYTGVLTRNSQQGVRTMTRVEGT